jgi:hypothetical protein
LLKKNTTMKERPNINASFSRSLHTGQREQHNTHRSVSALFRILQDQLRQVGSSTPLTADVLGQEGLEAARGTT